MKDEGLHLENMDRKVRPQDDFYNYVNGSWMKTAKSLLINQVGERLMSLLKLQTTSLLQS